MSLRTLIAIAALLTACVSVSTAQAACKQGSPACPIEVQMAPGTDTITVSGFLRRGGDTIVAYSLRARARQVMTWRAAGPALWAGIRYPNGAEQGPGLPTSIRLPQSGVYLFGVRPNLMAENASGPFSLK